MDSSKSKIQDEINNIPLVDDDPQLVVHDDNESSAELDGSHSNNSVDSIPSMFTNDSGSPSHNHSNSDISPDELEEKARLITQVLELQNTLDDLSHRVESVKDETMKLRSENQVLGQYIENLMSASSVFQSTSPKQKKK
ncbi:hypothetical protein V9T40_005584 [Parthenolecanium corni]|uniref:Short coiled-coil protein n=1 Tax=Parthenolecanium corni TaxID=536013 RepID=A0AAN9Y8U8_9HEMI